MRVTSAATRTSWQLEQPMAIAECTDFPLAFASWHSRHLASSTFGLSGGCEFANADALTSHKNVSNAGSIRRHTMHVSWTRTPTASARGLATGALASRYQLFGVMNPFLAISCLLSSPTRGHTILSLQREQH